MIVYTGGTFDLLHPGHVQLFVVCRALAGPDGQVVVSVNSDAFVLQYKGREPVMNFHDRCTMIRAIRGVDLVIENFGGADSKPAIQFIHPDVIAIGDDWKGKDYYAQMQFTPEWLVEQGITLVYVPLLPDRSSTRLRNNVRTDRLL